MKGLYVRAATCSTEPARRSASPAVSASAQGSGVTGAAEARCRQRVRAGTIGVAPTTPAINASNNYGVR